MSGPLCRVSPERHRSWCLRKAVYFFRLDYDGRPPRSAFYACCDSCRIRPFASIADISHPGSVWTEISLEEYVVWEVMEE